ncbi:DeoR/GlpR family DNA-binding transcription regulator [Ornithinibacillus halotolerans]|uniref:DeoR family transcriptional regulator n=1 Tax=Ornithinibacillus halotolerans TaxID=1274357 RepID=A0A916WED7_9BACI|nr:DeoR/GlpR family DNA-binding transcription regulator [Ornithinibacillus halotolerans]GGA92826.1 DeoR family transcriptional regulator [Ornithinibacillus halotolerans]
MLTEERHSFILNELKRSGIVKTQAIMKALNCSESTIRRDLDHLEKAGFLTRVHGGAKRIYKIDKELSIQEKTFKNIQEKQKIAKLAASLLNDQDVIFLDAGTTTLAFIDYIQVGDITVVTNGIQHAALLVEKQIKTILLGGTIKFSTKAMIGSMSLRHLEEYRFNKAFIGINGIDQEFGCTTPDPEEAAIKKLAIQQSATSYLLADETKWNKVNFAKVCDISDVTIITNPSYVDLTTYQENTTILEATS